MINLKMKRSCWRRSEEYGNATEMPYLRDLSKKEVDLLVKAQSCTELEKCRLAAELEKRGGKYMAYSGTEEDADFTYLGSKSAYVSAVAESKDSDLDNEVRDPEVRATSLELIETGVYPVSTNKQRSSFTETKRNRALLALVFDDNLALDTPQPLWKTHSEFEISEDEYGRSKALYEMLLDRTQRVEMWISYAQFEAFARIRGSEIGDRRKCLERGRAVFERGLSYFRRCAPKLKKERKMLLEEWFDVEYRFGEIGDVGSIPAKLPQKLKKKRRLRTEDGSTRCEEYIDYVFPKEKDVRILKKHKTSADSD